MFVFFCIKPIFVNWVNVELISRFKKNQSKYFNINGFNGLYILFFAIMKKQSAAKARAA